MDKICRICLRKSQTLLSIGEDSQLPRKIETISSVQILLSDNLPKNICAECIVNVNLFYNFQKLIINSDFELRKYCGKISGGKKQEATVLDNDFHDDTETLLDGKKYISTPTKLTTRKRNTEIKIVKNINESDEDVPNTELSESASGNVVTTGTYSSQVHSYGVSRSKVYKCRSCDFSHTEYKTYRRHKRVHWTNKGVTRAICSTCGKSIRAENLRKHMLIHTHCPVPCEICGKMCKNSESLRGHALIHRGIKLECKICGKVYKYRSGYALHLKRHAAGNKRTKKCSLCDKMFFENVDLKKHLRTHTGERPYPCEFCKKGFSSSHALKTHRRQHTNERPYVCTECPMAFPQRVSLRTHMKSKHSIDITQASQN